MELYILFEYEGINCVAKKTPFTREERMNGYHYYDLVHLDEDDYFPAYIVKDAERSFYDYWGSIMTQSPLPEAEKEHGSIMLYDFDDDEHGEEVAVPNKEFVTNVHFNDLRFYQEGSRETYFSRANSFRSILAVWQMVDPHFYEPEDMKMDRVWAMASKNPFSIKPVKELLGEELEGGLIIDPFANTSTFGHVTNDLNESMDTNYHMDAWEFLKLFPDESVDVVLFEPPYSARQIKECYESVGLDTQGGVLTRASYWSNLKKEIARILRVGGKAISFGWNSGGMNNKELFHINRIRLIPHGGNHNDTIVTVSVKVKALDQKTWDQWELERVEQSAKEKARKGVNKKEKIEVEQLILM